MKGWEGRSGVTGKRGVVQGSERERMEREGGEKGEERKQRGKVKEERKRTEDAVNVGQEKMRKAGEIDG